MEPQTSNTVMKDHDLLIEINTRQQDMMRELQGLKQDFWKEIANLRSDISSLERNKLNVAEGEKMLATALVNAERAHTSFDKRLTLQETALDSIKKYIWIGMGMLMVIQIIIQYFLK